MYAGRFSRLFVRDHEAGAGALLCAFTVLGAARVLQIPGRSKETSDRSGAATATSKGRKEIAAGVDAPTNRRITQRAAAGGEATRRAGMDAAPRRRGHGAFLQQWIATWKMSIFTPSPCAFLEKAAKSAFARLAHPRWRQSKNIAPWRMCIPERSSLTNHGNEFRRDRSG